ncbi:MAG: hypothetical protein OXC14_01395, partial [Rhodospirillaceae bacterium]|nr:hypothetical protein [Rhodospirillaceae bacterium]
MRLNRFSRLLKNDSERSSRQFCFVCGQFPILFFRERPSVDSFVSRGGLSAEFFSNLLVRQRRQQQHCDNVGDLDHRV